MSNSQNNKKIDCKLFDLECVGYSENSISKFNLSIDDIKNRKVGISTELIFNPDSDIVQFNIDVVCKLNELQLFKIETHHKFTIKNLLKFKEGDDFYNLPEELMVTLMSISISQTRGMLSVSKKEPSYKNITIPLLDPRAVLKNLMERKN